MVQHWLAALADARECYVKARDSLFQATRVRGLDGLAITNHDRIGDALRIAEYYPEQVIVGCEYSVAGGTGYLLHIVVLDVPGALHEELDRVRHWGLAPFVRAVKRSGRGYYLAHVAWGLFHEKLMTPEAVHGWLAHFSTIEVLNSTRTRENELAAKLARYYGLVGVGGSDGHELSSIGRAYTEAPEANSKQAFLEAFKAGEVRPGGDGGGVAHFRRTIQSITAGFYLSEWDHIRSAESLGSYLGQARPLALLRNVLEVAILPHLFYLPHITSIRQVDVLEADVDRLEREYRHFLKQRVFEQALNSPDLSPTERAEVLQAELSRIHQAFDA